MKITNSLNDQLMCMAAHRYCLGRSSYIVGSCLEWLGQHWDQFSEQTQNVMMRDTCEALQDNRTGWAIDTKGWQEFVRWAWKHLNDKQRESLYHSMKQRMKYGEEPASFKNKFSEMVGEINERSENLS